MRILLTKDKTTREILEVYMSEARGFFVSITAGAIGVLIFVFCVWLVERLLSFIDHAGIRHIISVAIVFATYKYLVYLGKKTQ